VDCPPRKAPRRFSPLLPEKGRKGRGKKEKKEGGEKRGGTIGPRSSCRKKLSQILTLRFLLGWEGEGEERKKRENNRGKKVRSVNRLRKKYSTICAFRSADGRLENRGKEEKRKKRRKEEGERSYGVESRRPQENVLYLRSCCAVKEKIKERKNG